MELKSVENIGRDMRDSILQLLREYSEALFLAVLMAVILRLFVFSAYKVSNLSMEPSLMLGDFVLGYKLPYGLDLPFSDTRVGKGTPRRGDVVIFRCPKSQQNSCVKRVVGLPGDRIEIVGQRLVVNGRKARYLKLPQKGSTLLRGHGEFLTLNEKSTHSSQAILVSIAGETHSFGPYIVPPESFFVLSDNRDISEDSRHWGAVPFDHLEARAALVWFSVDWQPKAAGGFTADIRWERILSLVR